MNQLGLNKLIEFLIQAYKPLAEQLNLRMDIHAPALYKFPVVMNVCIDWEHQSIICLHYTSSVREELTFYIERDGYTDLLYLDASKPLNLEDNTNSLVTYSYINDRQIEEYILRNQYPMPLGYLDD